MKAFFKKKATSYKKKEIVILCDAGMRYKYPHPLDIAELLALSSYNVVVCGPPDAEVKEWNAGRGFEYDEINLTQSTLRNLFILIKTSFSKYRQASVIIACTTRSLVPAYLLKLLKGSRLFLVFYALELEIPFKGGGSYSFLQYFLNLFTNKVITTGHTRASILKKEFTLKTVPGVILNAALKTPCQKGKIHFSLKELVFDKIGRYPKHIAVTNGGLSALNNIYELIEASQMWESDCALALIGPLDAALYAELKSKFDIDNLRSVCYLGEIQGSRADLIMLNTGASLGFALKKNDPAQVLNDQLYTPNKLFDYIAAGIPVICSENAELCYVEQDKLGLVINSGSSTEIAKTVDIILGSDEVYVEYKESVMKAFDDNYNYEHQTTELRDQISDFLNKQNSQAV